MSGKVWDGITYLFQNFNGCAMEVWELRFSFIPQFIMSVITYTCWQLNHVSKTSPSSEVIHKVEININTFISIYSNMKLLMNAGFHNLRYENHLVCRLLLAGFYLMCTQPCLGLDLHNQDPKLTWVPVGLPTDIIELDLRSNEISEIRAEDFTGLSSVVDMDLSYNLITRIDDLAFMPCAALSTLNLNKNRLTDMPSTLGPNSPYMLSFSIYGNPSCMVEASWIRQFRSLQ